MAARPSAAARPRPDFQQHIHDLENVPVGTDSPLYWKTPWKLVHDDLPEMQERRAWPDDLFDFFEHAVQSENIIESEGAHAFFDVLLEQKELLTPEQRFRLNKALDAKVKLTYPAWLANCRLKEVFRSQKGLEDVFSDYVTGHNVTPDSVGIAISLFDTFEIVQALNPTKTRCSVSTARSGAWEFTVAASYLTLQNGRAPDPAHRDDLITSKIAGIGALSWLEETLDVIPAYDEQRRTDTLLAIPSALANTQKLRSEALGWQPDTFNAFLDLPELMAEYELSPHQGFGALLGSLTAPCLTGSARHAPAPRREIFTTLNHDQKLRLLQLLGEHAGHFNRDASELVAAFIVARYPEMAAATFFDQLEGSVKEAKDQARDLRKEAAVNFFVAEGRRCLGGGRAQSMSPAGAERSRSGSSVSPQPERQASAPARLRRRLSDLAMVLPPLSPRSLSTPKSGTPKTGT